MRSVLAELDALVQGGPAAPGISAEELAGERGNTVDQLNRMLEIAAEEGDAAD